MREFTGPALAQIAFPVGGIGTGCISVGGRGNLQDFEIHNRPGKGDRLWQTFTAIRVKGAGAAPDARVLERAYLPPFVGALGFRNGQVPALPRFREARFRGDYPYAEIDFEDASFPATVGLTAWNPFVPMDVASSSIPGLYLDYLVSNPTDAPMEVSVLAVMRNPVAAPMTEFGSLAWGIEDSRIRAHLGIPGVETAWREEGALRGLWFSGPGLDPDDDRFGSAALTTDFPDLDVSTSLRRGAWWDALQELWDDFLSAGNLRVRTDTVEKPGEAAALCLKATLAPGETKTFPLRLHWHLPNARMWGGDKAVPAKTFVSRQFEDAWAAARWSHDNAPRLARETRAWRDAFHQASLPPEVIDAAGSALSTLRSPTVMRLADGHIYAWEGCGDQQGSCAGNCTHVWNYEQALAFLFPELERGMREIEFGPSLRADGTMTFRCEAPIGAGNTFFHETPPCADGQMGAICQVHRDWRLSGDDAFLRRLWPNVKRALAYAWTSPLGWDPDRDGVMEGSQHNTYDIEFYGPNTMTGSLYLAALKAAAAMAAYLGDPDGADYQRLFDTGRAKTEATLWNGEHFIQTVEVMAGLTVPRRLSTPDTDPVFPRYQYGEGCLSDQLLGAWQARVCGLGDILDPEKVRSALAAIYRHNFRTEIGATASVQRAFALQDEAGLLLCSWPRGGRPALPFVYSDEVWTGIEYQVAAHMIYEGLVEEGLTIVRAARARYDGVRRNPWDEIECGHHYARALSSWSLIQALTGAQYSAIDQSLTFDPRLPTPFRAFVPAGSAWGVAEFADGRVRFEVLHGTLTLTRFGLGAGMEVTERTLHAGDVIEG